MGAEIAHTPYLHSLALPDGPEYFVRAEFLTGLHLHEGRQGLQSNTYLNKFAGLGTSDAHCGSYPATAHLLTGSGSRHAPLVAPATAKVCDIATAENSFVFNEIAWAAKNGVILALRDQP